MATTPTSKPTTLKVAAKAPTILSQRHYRTVCGISILLYSVSHIGIGLNKLLTTNPICPLDVTPSSWAIHINLLICGAILAGIFLQINRICLSTFREEGDIGTLSTYFASLCVNTIAATSLLSSTLWGWGGICIDAFG